LLSLFFNLDTLDILQRMDIKYTLDRFPPNWIKRLYDFFIIIPPGVKTDNYWFYNISNLAYVLVALLHASWMIVFYFMGQSTMMYTQLISVSCYATALFFNRKGYHAWAMAIGLAEANLHQVLAAELLGWGTGFQNFIPLIALLPFLKYNESWVTKFALAFGCLLCYMYIDQFIKNTPTTSNLAPAYANFLSTSNSVICFILVALWGIVLALSYQRAASALIKKEQEFFAAQKANEQAEILRKLELKERDNEIFHLRNIELKDRNLEIIEQKQVIEQLVTEQEKIIRKRTGELEEANLKLIHTNDKLIVILQYYSHNLREPLTRIMMGMTMYEYLSTDEFYKDILPQMEKAAKDLDERIIAVTNIAEDII